ncbi:hypothetical protein ACQ3G4_22480 [bacterium BS0013]
MSLHASTETDRAYCAALRASQHGKKILSQTKIALHRTRLRFLDHKNFSVLFFFKTYRQTAPVLAALQKTQTEKIEKNFSVFHFYGSAEDQSKNVTYRKIKEILILSEWAGSFRLRNSTVKNRFKSGLAGITGWLSEFKKLKI